MYAACTTITSYPSSRRPTTFDDSIHFDRWVDRDVTYRRHHHRLFGEEISDKRRHHGVRDRSIIDHRSRLVIRAGYLYVATLPWTKEKFHFSTYIHANFYIFPLTSYYFLLFSSVSTSCCCQTRRKGAM